MRTMQKSKGIWTGTFLALCLIMTSGACQANSVSTGSVLTLDETPLQGPPNSDNGIFLPIGTTQEEVLGKHSEERERTVYNEFYQADGDVYPRTNSLGPGQELIAILGTSTTETYRQTVSILNGDENIFNVDAGLPSPALPLQGLWSYPDHWALEILYSDEETWQGRVYLDGELLNESLNYQEVFGFQLLEGKPFYFYQREDGLGYNYDGIETSLPYDEIPHYNCCSAYVINPIPAENMVAFFARTGDQWFYVELGDFSQEP